MTKSPLALVLLLPAAALAPPAGSGGRVFFDAPEPLGRACTATDVSEYYQIELVTTRRVPGSARARGVAAVYDLDSPFPVSVAADGRHIRRLDISIDRLAPVRDGVYVAWVTTPNLDRVELLGALDAEHRLIGEASFNKFLVVISLEADAATLGSRWSGPIVLRGLSKSGFLHTVLGHGPFETESCVSLGFNEP
ncbi:MAG: hypothetical protein O7I93_10945 [Gemmatimonadetes bacterium]|nr:hypothetical protein [Gemmatimonadota bacterium]